MKKIQYLSYRTQIFLASLSLVILPSILLGLFAVNDSASRIMQEYNTSFTTILTQANLTLDTLLQDASKVADMPILSEDVRRAMTTDYGDDYLSYAQTSTQFRDLFNQTNRLNTDLETCIFTNLYGYTFEYNVISTLHKRQIDKNIEKWTDIARSSPNYTYFAPLQVNTYTGANKRILPMIKILRDKYNSREIGICYCEINFKPIENLLLSAQNAGSTLFIYNADGELTFSSNPVYTQNAEKYKTLLNALNQFNASLSSDSSITQTKLPIDHTLYQVNGCVNATTSWHLVQFVDNQLANTIYRDNIFSYLRIFLVCIVLGMLLAMLISGTLTRSILKLCNQIDSINTTNGGQIDERACGSNQELRRLVSSFNDLNQRLTASLQQNYKIQLAEQRVRIQMLQFQINHHFLYNTLNVIRSLANLHDVPEISTIAVCMSDLLRYNLKKFPTALLEEELQQIHRYMTIQNIRFPNKFTFDCNIPPTLLQMQIPAFLLQPLVENSIEHGFASKESGCYISISCQKSNGKLHLFVTDNGCGISPDLLHNLNKACREDTIEYSSAENPNRSSIGVRNVNQRIRSHFGMNYGLSVESMVNEGTIVDIVLPDPDAGIAR
ncbi:MAG: histidine kinase [Eubacteriales bacterium]|nr:histidine kinase [Eubacteriales bacterium]